MPKEYSRTQRVADYLQRELAILIQREVRDPRVGMVSITGVDVSRDLGHARVYYTVLGSDSSEDAADSTAALNRAAGFLRSQLSRDSTMRSVPQLKFYFDSSVRRGRELEDLIQRAAIADRKMAGGEVED
jgi:ribosome-binding factor A